MSIHAIVFWQGREIAMGSEDKGYYARRAAEEAELADRARDPAAAAAHRKLQRGYIERASIGEREQRIADPIG
jgi:hypothetical protein